MCGVTIDVWQGGMERERKRESTGSGERGERERESIIKGEGEGQRGEKNLTKKNSTGYQPSCKQELIRIV